LWKKILGRIRDDRSAAARRRNESAATRIGARDGEFVRSEQTGGRGLNGPPGLVVVTIRPGQPEDVLHALIESAVAAGYPRPPWSPRGYGNACLFPTTEELPTLHVEVLPPSGRFRVAKRTVPDGHTGVVISLHTQLEAR
jgi:hypothetical protein